MKTKAIITLIECDIKYKCFSCIYYDFISDFKKIETKKRSIKAHAQTFYNNSILVTLIHKKAAVIIYFKWRKRHK